MKGFFHYNNYYDQKYWFKRKKFYETFQRNFVFITRNDSAKNQQKEADILKNLWIIDAPKK